MLSSYSWGFVTTGPIVILSVSRLFGQGDVTSRNAPDSILTARPLCRRWLDLQPFLPSVAALSWQPLMAGLKYASDN